MGYNAVKTGTHCSCRPVRRWRHRPKCGISQDMAVGKSDGFAPSERPLDSSWRP